MIHDDELLDYLAQFDTPTICNALELIDPSYRTNGFTTEPLSCIYPDLPSIVGYAKTGTVSAIASSKKSAAEQLENRINWYKYVDQKPKPSIVVLFDIDGKRAGFGAFWGEVNSHVHRGLGAKGVITNGSIRDIQMNATGFQMLAGSVMPSHAHVHIVDIACDVTVAGLSVRSGDLIHADRHGAVMIPHDAVTKIKEKIELIARKEEVIISAAKKPGFNWEILSESIKKTLDIH